VEAEEDRNLQLRFWRKQDDDSIKVYSLNMVTVLRVHHILRCLQQLSKKDRTHFSLALRALQFDFYMDDVLTGSDNVAETIILQKQFVALISKK